MTKGWYPRLNTKPLTSELLDLDMLYFARTFGVDVAKPGSIYWKWAGGRRESIGFAVLPGQGVKVMYRQGNEQLDYIVRVTFSRMKIAGKRPWWLCPQCERRCRILYGRRLFVCRHCADVIYETQRTKALSVRAENQLRRLRHKLGASAFDETIPHKPKRMWWKTYMRIARRIEMAEKLKLIHWAEEISTMLERR